jgi:hypothetical protein
MSNLPANEPVPLSEPPNVPVATEQGVAEETQLRPAPELRKDEPAPLREPLKVSAPTANAANTDDAKQRLPGKLIRILVFSALIGIGALFTVLLHYVQGPKYDDVVVILADLAFGGVLGASLKGLILAGWLNEDPLNDTRFKVELSVPIFLFVIAYILAVVLLSLHKVH